MTTTAEAIEFVGQASDGRGINIVDGLLSLADAAKRVGDAITPSAAVAGQDAVGGYISSLTEAVMGITGGLVKCADAIHALALVVQRRDEDSGLVHIAAAINELAEAVKSREKD